MAGIYIHIPFCRQACTYCNFHFSTSLAQKENFLRALHKEIESAGDFIDSKETIETIYFGGGTPSLLSPDELSRIMEILQKKFLITQNAEITLEANPDDISKNIVKQWMQYGINRLSLGLQSFKEEELKWMNRAHNANQSLQSIAEVSAAGMSNFSADLIFGSPFLSTREFEHNLMLIFENNIPHLSCYALTVEPKTALNKLIAEKKASPVDTEKQAEQFLLLMKLMEIQGYEHYEISNFAKPGMRSRHNSSYWQGKAYHGFGPSAHSFDAKNRRRWNVANNTLYIQSLEKNIIPFEEEILTAIQQLNEYIMISIRTIEGIDLLLVQEKFNELHAEKLKAATYRYIAEEKMIIKNNHLVLTAAGKLFADGIAADLFF